MDFPGVANAWLDSPSTAHLAGLHMAIQSQPNYTTSPNFIPAAEALRAGAYQKALDALSSWLPGAFLSPLAHGMLAQALTGLGRTRAAELERRLARAALVTIFNSGDGSRTRPWIVLRVSDEYDIVSALGERAEVQAPVVASEQLFDRITTDRGRTHWFEMLRNGRRMAGAAA